MRARVVGAGIVGLTSALRLAESGHQVRVVAAQAPQHTTSAVAAALWYPYRAYPEAEVTRWSAVGYAALEALASDPHTGVALRSGRELFRTPVADPWWRSAVPELGRVARAELPEGYLDGYQLTVPVVDMALHLPWLVARLGELGVRVEVARLDELATAFAGVDVVVNCTGLGAGELAGDPSVRPVRGQVVVVEQFGLEEWVLDQSEPARLTYLVPRQDAVILGGTAEEGDAGLEVRPAVTEAILARCRALAPEVAGAQIIEVRVGARPARPTVRLATELSADGPIVHCYGHGGAGVTLSYGCAAEVLEQVSRLGEP